jgi:hypothetical protein
MSILQQDFTKLSQYDLHKFIRAIGADEHKKLLINNLESYGVCKKYKKDFIDHDDFNKTSADNLNIINERVFGGVVSFCKFESFFILYGEQTFKEYINDLYNKSIQKTTNVFVDDETLEIKSYYFYIGEQIYIDFGLYKKSINITTEKIKQIAFNLQKIGVTHIEFSNSGRKSKHENLELKSCTTTNFFDAGSFKTEFETFEEFSEYFVTYYIEIILADDDQEKYYKIKDGEIVIKCEHYHIDKTIFLVFDTYQKIKE